MTILFEDFLAGEIFGNTLLQYFIFIGLIIGAIILGKLTFSFFRSILRVLTKKTKSEFDDILIESSEGPLVLAIIIICFFFGYKQLNLSQGTENIFNLITKNFVVIAIGWLIIKLVDEIIEHYLMPLALKTESDLDDHLIPLIKKISKYCLIFIIILIVLSNMGINVTSAIAGLGIGGLAVALAAQESLKNILGGIAILTDKPFKLGEWVEIDKYQGTVVEIGLRSTRLKTTTGEYITIPNSLIATTATINYLRYPTKKLAFVISLTYSTSTDKIQKAKVILKRILESTPKIEKDTIEIQLVRLGTYSVDLDVKAGILTNAGGETNIIKDSINMRILKEFSKEKIQIAVPAQSIEIRR